MSKSYLAPFALVLLLSVTACRREEQCSQPTVTPGNIQGSWKHQYPTELEPGFSQPDHYDHLRFKADSFYLQKTYVTDVIQQGCTTTEYMKGIFRINEQVLVLDGLYTEADYQVKTGGCNHTGPFSIRYDIRFCDEALLLYLQAGNLVQERYKNITLIRD